MNNAVLIYNNHVVKLKGTNYALTNCYYDFRGPLLSFTNNEVKYIHNGFVINNKEINGYCKLTAIEQYKNKLISEEDFIKKENWFDHIFELAGKGDLIEITRVEFINENGEQDFMFFYYENTYKFVIAKTDINFSNPNEYPTNYEVIHRKQDHNNIKVGLFYSKNFGSKIANLKLTKSSAEIDILANYMILICFRIYHIMDEKLLDTFAIEDFDTIENDTKFLFDNPIDRIPFDTLPFIDRLIGLLSYKWCYFSERSDSLPELFPVLEENLLKSYYISLKYFYEHTSNYKEDTLFKYDSGFPLNGAGIPLTKNRLEIKEKDSDRRLTKLIGLLPGIGFSLFSPEERLKLLDKALDYLEIYEDRPEFKIPVAYGGMSTTEDSSILIESDIIKLVASFNTTYAEANLLLDFLLRTKDFDGDKPITKFERLYNLIDDKGADNIAIVNWFVSEENNRGRLMLVLYEIWQKSKYFFYSQPPGVALNSNGVNPENYFLFTPAGKSYLAKYDETTGAIIPGSGSEPLLEFKSTDLRYGIKYLIKYIPKKIEKEKIIVNKKLIFENYVSDYVPDALELGHQLPEVYFGSYHLYQTIGLVGFKLDEDIVAQSSKINLGLIPAFLFHYVDEFDRLKNVYAGISLVIEVALEVGLFFATAGSSAALTIRHLRHLRHITKLGRIVSVTGTLESGVVATEVLFTFRVAEGALEIVSMSAGVASSYLQYLSTVTDDPFKRKLSYFFTAFALASAGGAIYSNRKVVKLADDILTNSPVNLITHLQANASEVYNLLLQVAGKRVTALAEFANSIDDLPIVKDFYNNLLTGPFADLKPKFFEDFGASAIDVLNRLENPQVLSNWKKMAEINAKERKLLEIITNADRTVTLEKFYSNSPLRAKLDLVEINQKISFIDNFKNIDTTDLNKFVSDPDLVTHWFRYYDESILRADFIRLTKTNQLKFLEDYADATQSVFIKFRQNSSLIKHWDECHIDYILYRSEIRFLEELHHFKIDDINAFDHLAFFKSRPKSGTVSTKFNCTGGHTEIIDFTGVSAHKIMSNNIEILDPFFTHTINTPKTSQRMVDYLNNTLNNTNSVLGKKYSKTTTSNGHFEHRDILFKVDPQPSTLSTDWVKQWVLNGELYQFKRLHTQYNPLWTEQKIIHDMAFASKNKVLKPSTALNVNPHTEISEHGLNQLWVETIYESSLLDGTNVILKHVNYHRYNLQTHFNNHYPYFELQ